MDCRGRGQGTGCGWCKGIGARAQLALIERLMPEDVIFVDAEALGCALSGRV